MIIPDVNVLIYSVDSTSPRHDKTRRWWDALLSSDAQVGLCLPVITGFVRLTTHQRVFERPLTVADATDRVSQWLTQPFVELLLPSARHWEVMRGLLTQLGTGANLTTDCDVATYAVTYTAEIATNDRDFGRFPVACFDPTT